jgi:hypothetical protein
MLGNACSHGLLLFGPTPHATALKATILKLREALGTVLESAILEAPSWRQGRILWFVRYLQIQIDDYVRFLHPPGICS